MHIILYRTQQDELEFRIDSDIESLETEKKLQLIIKTRLSVVF